MTNERPGFFFSLPRGSGVIPKSRLRWYSFKPIGGRPPNSMLLGLGDLQRLRDHQRARQDEEQRHRMEVEAPDAPHASEHRIADAPGAREGHEEDDEEDARGDGRPFEIRDLARLRGHGFRGDVVAREAADAAGHEVDQAESIPESRHARG